MEHTFKVKTVNDKVIDIKRKFSADIFLKNPHLLHWYGMNCNRNPDPSKFTCLPLGISQWNNERETMTKFAEKGYTILWRSPLIERQKANNKALAIVSFTVDREERKKVYKQFCLDEKSPLKNVSICNTGFQRSNQSVFYHNVATTKFVVSPHGHGLDCYRTWSALYLGAYPIVKASSLDEQYKGLPVLIVKKWKDVTIDLLEKTAQDFDAKRFDYSKLFKGYWYEKFRSHYRI